MRRKSQLVHDGYGVFALSLKKILIPNCETIASNKLLKIVKLGLAVSKYLDDSDIKKDDISAAHCFRPNTKFNSSFFSASNEQSQNLSQQQNGSGSSLSPFSVGNVQPIKMEPGEREANSFHFPFSTYARPWTQINRSTINLDRDIHELPSGGSPTKLFECSLCGKVFNRRDKVKRHLSELHHGIKSYQCATCARAFSRNDKLVRHIMTVHQGIKAFGCSQCSRRFSRRWEYQRHMQLIHPSSVAATMKSESNGAGSALASSPTVSRPSNDETCSLVSSAPTASSATPTEPCTSQPACQGSSSLPIPIVPSAVTNGVFSAFPMFNGGTSIPMCSSVPTLSTIPFSTHANNAMCPTQSIAFPSTVPYAGYMQPLTKSTSNETPQL